MAYHGKRYYPSRVIEAFLVSAGLFCLVGMSGCQTHCNSCWQRTQNYHGQIPGMPQQVWITEDGTPVAQPEMATQPPDRSSTDDIQPTPDSPQHSGPRSNGITTSETPSLVGKNPSDGQGNPQIQNDNRPPRNGANNLLVERNPIEVIEELGGILGFDDDQQVESVDLSESKVSNNQLKMLNGLKQLKQIKLNETAISNAGIVHLRSMAHLEILMLNRTKVSDSGLQYLAGMTQLKSLGLSRTAVTDSGLIHLENLKNLRFLLLDRTQITDAGLLHLHGLTNLEGLSLTNTHVTRAGVEQLRRTLPNCQIVFNQAARQSALPLNRPSFRFLPDAPLQPGPTFRTPQSPTTKIVNNIIETTRRHLQLGQITEAETGLTSLFSMRPGDPAVLEAMAQFYAAQGKTDEWCKMLKKTISSQADNQMVRFQLAVALADAGNSVAAFPHLVKTVGLAAAHYDVGILDFRNGNIRIAKRHFERALKLDPQLKSASTWIDSIQYPRRAKYVQSVRYRGGIIPATGLATIRPASKLPAIGQSTVGRLPRLSNRFSPFGRGVAFGHRNFGSASSSITNPLGTISINGNRNQNIPAQGPYKLTLQFGDATLTLDVKENRANASEGNPLRVSNSRDDRNGY